MSNVYEKKMDGLFQEETKRTSSPWEGSGANTPALAAEVDDSGNVEYKVHGVDSLLTLAG